MRSLLLIFCFSVFILLLGLLFGFNQIEKKYAIASRSEEIASPFEGELDLDFLRRSSF